MILAKLLRREAVSASLSSVKKSELIEELIDLLCLGHAGIDREAVCNAVFAREELISTGVGNGIAIPHAKVAGVSSIMISVGIKKEGVDFESLDSLPTKIFFLIIAPVDADAQLVAHHLKVMARVSALLKDEQFCNKLLMCSSADEVIDAITMGENGIE